MPAGSNHSDLRNPPASVRKGAFVSKFVSSYVLSAADEANFHETNPQNETNPVHIFSVTDFAIGGAELIAWEFERSLRCRRPPCALRSSRASSVAKHTSVTFLLSAKSRNLWIIDLADLVGLMTPPPLR